jgi:hypothetical protein
VVIGSRGEQDGRHAPLGWQTSFRIAVEIEMIVEIMWLKVDAEGGHPHTRRFVEYGAQPHPAGRGDAPRPARCATTELQLTPLARVLDGRS